jgi:mono/diheme cytochrome c family protein
MLRRTVFFVLLVLLVVAVGLAFVAYQFNLSALNEPGQTETYLATRAKRWLVSRSARGPLPPVPPSNSSNAALGEMDFMEDCAACHGKDGRKPTDIGRWMYPRSLDLGSPGVQQWSDAELFWIIKNGIRLSGMPGFGKIHSDKEIWNLVQYVRSLGAPPKR